MYFEEVMCDHKTLRALLYFMAVEVKTFDYSAQAQLYVVEVQKC